ncbi:MAG: DUF1592 domain-containing protein [Steroidobacteraceae bacterium]
MHIRLKLLVLAPIGLGSLALLWTASAGQSEASDTPAAAQFDPKQLASGFDSTVHPFIKTYCVECHSGEFPEAELDLSAASLAWIKKDPARWSQILERVEAGEMPPADAKTLPTAVQRGPTVAWLHGMHDFQMLRTAGDPGTVLARRLSNAEYDYTVRDLTGMDIRPTKEFPVDPANAAGFDNSGESLAMSPALVQKYVDAARHVADHLVFTPAGLRFAPYPMTTQVDRDRYTVSRIVDFYKRQGVSIATQFDNYMAQSLDYADFLAAAWRFQNRVALGRGNATLTDFAKDAKISPKYLTTLWTTLTTPDRDAGPIAALQARWRNLPAPSAGKEPSALRDGCVAIRDFILNLRSQVRMKFENVVPGDRIIASGSQPMVLWKDRKFAENRTTYAGNALTLNLATLIESDPALAIPATDMARARYEESFKRFCAVFPDAFYVSERARMFLNNANDIATDLQGHRLLTAGFHSQMGYFRDDKPLYDLVLDEQQRRELDTLWWELDFIAQVPARQLKEFIWFERAEPPSVMVDPIFASFQSADDDLLTPAKLQRLAQVYSSRAENMRLAVPPRREGGADPGIPLNFRSKPLAPGEAVPEGFTEFRLSETAAQAVREYFPAMNARIRAVEKAQQAAEPLQLKALVDFAERAYRRPLAPAESKSLLAFYRSLRDEKLSHEDAIRDCVVSVLMSPAFSYRFDLPRSGAGNLQAGTQPLNNYELANRLSYFLWSSMPDAELLARAAAGDLAKPDVLVAQARRMLRDDRVRGFATEFGGNWLDIRRFEEHNAVDRERFPAFTTELREAMFEEPIRFTVDLVQRNGSVLDFVYGNYTFVNATLARHYGMTPPASPTAWTRIDDASKYQRGGILPMAAFMTKHAPGLRTSPVKRGYWVVTKLLGQRIPAPPPNVPVLPTDETKLGDLTLRQTLAKHREDKSCASCHNKFDSFGLVFEGYGPVGEVRATDLAGRPIETSAVFPDGSEHAGVTGLQSYLRTKAEPEFVGNLSRRLLAYALGRTLLPSDDPLVTAMRQKLSADGYRFDNMVESIVTSRQFLNKRISPDPGIN